MVWYGILWGIVYYTALFVSSILYFIFLPSQSSTVLFGHQKTPRRNSYCCPDRLSAILPGTEYIHRQVIKRLILKIPKFTEN